MSVEESRSGSAPGYSLRFDEASHRYWLNGVDIPGITSRLKAVGYIDESVFSPGARERGTAVHLATQFADEGDLQEDSVAPSIRGYVEAWCRFVGARHFEIIERPEVLAASPSLWFATKIDRVGLLDGRLTVVNIKTSASPYKWWPLQLAGEAIAYSEWTGVPLYRLARVSVRVHQDATFHVDAHDEKSDYDDWRALVRLAARMERDGVAQKRKSNEQSGSCIAA